MSIDKRVREYMAGWLDETEACFSAPGVACVIPPEGVGEDYERGKRAAHAAYSAAEKAELERLEGRCPVCHGDGHDVLSTAALHESRILPCGECGGTGHRRA